MNSKGAIKLLTATAVASAIGMVGSTAMASNIASIETQANNSTASITSDPVIEAILSQPGTFDGKTYTGWSYLVQDSSGSLDIFYSSTASSYVPVVGNAVSISGNFSPFDGIPEVDNSTANPLSISTVSTGNAVAPSIATIPQVNVTSETANDIINTPYAGYYVQLDNVTISGAGGLFPTAGANASYTLTDTSNNSMVMFFWTTSYSTDGAMGGTTIPSGEVDVDGFVDYFAGSSESEFVATSITPVPEPGSMALYGVGSVLAGLFSYRFRKQA
jgi:hypothetical protein